MSEPLDPDLQHCLNQKLEAQKRKRALDGCEAKWEDPKYDTTFILNAMSDDEDDPTSSPVAET